MTGDTEQWKFGMNWGTEQWIGTALAAFAVLFILSALSWEHIKHRPPVNSVRRWWTWRKNRKRR